jgi:histidinol-phosphate phosphatase family protein
VVARGWRIVRGARTAAHPVLPADPWVSVRLQANNAADPLMRTLHGPRWRDRAGVASGRRPRHLLITAAAAAAAVAALLGHRRAAAAAAAGWAAGTVELAWARIAPGPWTPAEIATLAVTSALLPAAATRHWLGGWWVVLRDRPRRAPLTGTHGAAPAGHRPPWRPEAVLFDRDGTLLVDVPYNGDPAHVRPVPAAAAALARLRAAGLPTAVISNQSGVGRGLVTREQVDAVNRRVEDLLGPLGPWCLCPHAPADDCACRKPAPGLVHRAARLLGVDPARCVVIGDIGADVEAARCAGARAVLVPTAATLASEIRAAANVAVDLGEAVDWVLRGVVAPESGPAQTCSPDTAADVPIAAPVQVGE